MVSDNISLDESGLESRINSESIDGITVSESNTFIPDTFGGVTYSWVAGGILDYFTGLNLSGILAARLSSTGVNIATSGLYGLVQKGVLKLTGTTEKSGLFRTILAETLAFNLFQVPVYAGVVAVGSLISDGQVDMDKVQDGAKYLAEISLVSGPIYGWYLGKCRQFFERKSNKSGTNKNGALTPPISPNLHLVLDEDGYQVVPDDEIIEVTPTPEIPAIPPTPIVVSGYKLRSQAA